MLFLREKADRPDEWVPPEVDPIKDNCKIDEYTIMSEVNEDERTGIVDIFSVHSVSGTGDLLLCYKYCSEFSKCRRISNDSEKSQIRI